MDCFTTLFAIAFPVDFAVAGFFAFVVFEIVLVGNFPLAFVAFLATSLVGVCSIMVFGCFLTPRVVGAIVVGEAKLRDEA